MTSTPSGFRFKRVEQRDKKSLGCAGESGDEFPTGRGSFGWRSSRCEAADPFRALHTVGALGKEAVTAVVGLGERVFNSSLPDPRYGKTEPTMTAIDMIRIDAFPANGPTTQ